MSELPVQPIEDVPVDLSLPREEAEALLLAVDALRPLLERVRAEIAPEPEPEPASAPVATLVLPDHEDALRRVTWAVVGCSPRPHRDSHRIAGLLHQRGNRVIPVNPDAAGQQILGERCEAWLT